MQKPTALLVISLILFVINVNAQINNTYFEDAVSYSATGKHKQAVEALKMSAQKKETLTAFEYYNMAEIYAKAGDKKQSLESLHIAIDKGFWAINWIKENTILHTVYGAAEWNSELDRLRAKAAPYLQGKAVLTADEKKEILSLAEEGLKTLYFDTAKASLMIKELKKMAGTGFFNGKDTLSSFTNSITNYLRDQTHDKHFYIGFNYSPVTERVPNLTVTTDAERNYGFSNVRIMPGNIGYIRWDECIDGDEAYKTAFAALNFLRNTRALVLDIRENSGGSGNISTFLYHYLFAENDKRFETLLIKKCKGEPEWHRSEPPVEPLPGGPSFGKKPVYIVTSGNTFSAAEYFAFIMKELKRATIIGHNTGGGGNPVSIIPLNNYIFFVPVCQITTQEGKSLEGKGVAPDILFTTQDWNKEMEEVVNRDLKSKGK